MKLATWNINSIRVRTERLVAWLAREAPDVLCLQETKVEDSGFPLDALRAAGYEVAIYGQRSYNGVAIASRVPLTDVARGFGDGEPDDDARVIAATVHGTAPPSGGAADAGQARAVDGVRVVCVYVPNGQDLASDKFSYKLAWYARLRRYLARTSSPSAQLAVCGDFNVTRDDLDVWSPEAWAGKIHCSPQERAALEELLSFGLTDVFRVHAPEGKLYWWWDYRGVALFKNQGLRIDYVFATAPLAARCTACTIDKTARKGQDASDHAPVIATFT